MIEFKIGDRIECIDTGDDWLCYGVIYTIKKMDDNYVWLIEDTRQRPFGYWKKRFELTIDVKEFYEI